MLVGLLADYAKQVLPFPALNKRSLERERLLSAEIE